VRTQAGGSVQRQIFYGGAIEKELDYTQNRTTVRTYLPLGAGYLEYRANDTLNNAASQDSGPYYRFFHRDHLGSLAAITDGQNNTVQRLSYDPWGRRRNNNGTDDAWSGLGTLSNTADHTGYSGEEHLDQLGLVHLNGRVYDPITARMTSADPTVPDPTDLQSLNRFSYVLNSPLVFIDPSGFEVQDPIPGNVTAKPKAPEASSPFPSPYSGTGVRIICVSVDCGFPVQLMLPGSPSNGNAPEVVSSGDRAITQIMANYKAQAPVTVANADTIEGARRDDGGEGYFLSVMDDQVLTFNRQGGEVSQVVQITGRRERTFLPAGYGSAVFGDFYKLHLSFFATAAGIPAGTIRGAAWVGARFANRQASVVANGIRGRASEARVLQEIGLAKNTKAVSTAEGRSIPDALTDSLSVEVKDAANVSLTRQLQIQTDAAKASGRESLLITGENTCVSGSCAKAFDQIIRRPDLGPR
jgi:RHS repeat-associated protein